jgi:hypothetical protein
MNELDRNSMFIWLPAVEACGIPFPKTVMLRAPRELLSPMVDGGTLDDELLGRIKEVAGAMGYPLFLRTDLASGKHSWRETCFVTKADDLLLHLYRLIEENEMFGLEYGGLAFREYLELDSTFKAFLDMPVSAERRYFAQDGKVLCHHPYWPEDAIDHSWREKPADWKERLALLNDEDGEDGDPDDLTRWASMVTTKLAGAWSVDFARLRDRRHWVLIDMALAEESWHPEHQL